MTTFWISFADEHGCLGCTIIDAEYPGEALVKAGRLRCNPGGEARIFPMSKALADREGDLFGKHRLILPNELRANGYRTFEEYAAAKAKAASELSSEEPHPEESDGQRQEQSDV